MNRKAAYIIKFLVPALLIVATTYTLAQVAISAVHVEKENKLAAFALIMEDHVKDRPHVVELLKQQDASKLRDLMQPLLEDLIFEDTTLGGSVYLPEQEQFAAFAPKSLMDGNMDRKISMVPEALQAYQTKSPVYYEVVPQLRKVTVFNYAHPIVVDGEVVALLHFNQTADSIAVQVRSIWLSGGIACLISLLFLALFAFNEYHRDRRLYEDLSNLTSWLKQQNLSDSAFAELDNKLILLKQLPSELKKTVNMINFARKQKRHVLDQLSIGVMTWDAEGKLAYLNPTLLKLIGCTREEALSWSTEEWRKRYQMVDGGYLAEMVARGEEIENRMGIILHPSGREIPFSVTVRGLLDEDQAPIGYLLFFKDMSEEFALDRQEQKIHYIFNFIPHSVIMIDTAQRIEYINPAVCRMFGCSERDLIGKQMQTALPWEMSQGESNLYEQVQKVLSTGMRRHVSDVQSVVHGRDYDLEFDLFPILNSFYAEADGCMILIKDKTLYREWEELSQRVDAHTNYVQMAATIAHEVRNPMTSVRGFLQLLSSQIDGQQQRMYLDVMQTEIDRMNTILSEYLSMARTPQPEWESIDLTHLVRDTFLLLEGEANYRGIGLNLELEDGCVINGLSRELKQVLINLVRNAFDAIDGSTGQIDIRLVSDSHSHRVSVTDTGCGIPQEELPRIFEPFFTTKAMGTGLGLPVCKKIIESHGGSLLVKSKQNEGTTFTVELPRSFQ